MARLFSTGQLARHITQQTGQYVDGQHIRRAITRGYVPSPARIGPRTRVFNECDVPRVIEGLRRAGVLREEASA